MFESGEVERLRSRAERLRNFQENPRNSQERRLRGSRTVLPSSIRQEHLYLYLHLFLYLYSVFPFFICILICIFHPRRRRMEEQIILEEEERKQPAWYEVFAFRILNGVMVVSFILDFLQIVSSVL